MGDNHPEAMKGVERNSAPSGALRNNEESTVTPPVAELPPAPPGNEAAWPTPPGFGADASLPFYLVLLYFEPLTVLEILFSRYPTMTLNL